jgi:quercetin dioxygenase-like cupin family protein
MKLITLTLLAAVAALAAGDDPAGFMLWKSAELKGADAALSTKMNALKNSSSPLGKSGNHNFMIAYREASGEVEVHTKANDVFVVVKGSCTLTVGGTVDNAKNTSPTEIRGTGITGGAVRKLAEGDIVHIPAGMPHLMTLAPGEKLVYFVVKVIE